jgi:hypothetical protein
MVNTSTKVEHATSAFAGGPPDPRDLVTAAITAANYAANGAPFAPLLIKFANPADFVNGWTTEKGSPISFYGEYKGDPSQSFFPLGDVAAVNNTPIAKTPILLVAPMPGNEGALAHPTGFTWILDDKGSGNPDDVAYFWPEAPVGYQALGICVGFNGQEPVAENYWCVRNEYLQSTSTEAFWSDAGQGWKSHDGSLSVPSLTGVGVQDLQLLLAPTTLLSNEHGNLQNTSWCLALDKLLLPVPGASTAFPDYRPEYGEGTTTAPGLDKVAVLPSSVIDDPRSESSPFYYLAAQPAWFCTRSFPVPKGGTYTQGFEIGTSQESSSGFQHTTSLTVGAEVGIEAGPASAKVSVSYTDEMQLSGSIVQGTETLQSESLELNLVEADRMLIWQKLTDFVVYRTAGDAMSQVTYQTADLYFTDSNSAGE